LRERGRRRYCRETDAGAADDLAARKRTCFVRSHALLPVGYGRANKPRGHFVPCHSPYGWLIAYADVSAAVRNPFEWLAGSAGFSLCQLRPHHEPGKVEDLAALLDKLDPALAVTLHAIRAAWYMGIAGDGP
jgi:hypothetical protein